jgi:hypothetical protein
MSYFGNAVSDFFTSIWNFFKEFFTLIGDLFSSIGKLADALKFFDTEVSTLAQDMQAGNFHGVRILEIMATIKYLVGSTPFNILFALILISFFMIVVPLIGRFIKFFKSINFVALFGDALETLKSLL